MKRQMTIDEERDFERRRDVASRLAFSESYISEDDFMFASKVLKSKLEAFNIPYKVSPCAIMMLDALSGCNPGGIQVLFIDTVKKIPIERRSQIKPTDILIAFGSTFPNPIEIEELWDKQKLQDYSNAVDKQEYWYKELEIQC